MVESTGLGKLSAAVLTALRADIANGIFDESGMLPTEMELCKRFEASRTTVRRAVARLADEGLIVVKKGAGMFLKPDAAERLRAARSTASSSDSRVISVMATFEDVEQYRQVQTHVQQQGYMLCIYCQLRSAWSPEREREFLRSVRDQRHRGLVAFCSPREPLPMDLLREVDGAGVRVIHMEPFGRDLPEQGFILPDYRAAGQMAATEFLLAGYRSIVFLPMASSPFEILMEDGFVECLRGHRSDLDSAACVHRITPQIQQEGSAREAFREWLLSVPRPAGLCFRSPAEGMVARNLLLQAGVSVPDEVGLIALNYSSSKIQPDIDTLEVHREEAYCQAIDAIAESIWNPPRRLVAPRLHHCGSIRSSVMK